MRLIEIENYKGEIVTINADQIIKIKNSGSADARSIIYFSDDSFIGTLESREDLTEIIHKKVRDLVDVEQFALACFITDEQNRN